MVIYTIKSLCTMEIEADSEEKAIEIYNQGLWDHNDMVDERGIELATLDENGDYKVIQS